MVRIVLFILGLGKNSYRIVENGENTIIVLETQLNDTQLNDAEATETISEKGNALTIEETVGGTPPHILNGAMNSALVRKFETFQNQYIGFLILKSKLLMQGIAILRK